MSTRRGVTNSTRPYTFADMVDNHQVEVPRYLRRLTSDVAEAEDLFQETFLRALPAFDRLRTGSNHRAWVYRVATHVFLNARRTKRRRKEVSLVTLVDALPAPGASVSDAHETKALAAVCRQAIASLQRRQRDIRAASPAWLGLSGDRGSDEMFPECGTRERLSSRASAQTGACPTLSIDDSVCWRML